MTPKSVAARAATVVMWAFLLGGVLAGYVSAFNLHQSIGTYMREGVQHSLTRLTFLDMLLADAVKRAQEAQKAP